MNERTDPSDPSEPSGESIPHLPPLSRSNGARERRMRPDGGATVVLAARGIVAYELTRWPDGDPAELDLAVERLAYQGQRLVVPIEALIVELKTLMQRHAAARRPEHECRPMRERLVSILIEAYYRAER
jgi:hypothetical protein